MKTLTLTHLEKINFSRLKSIGEEDLKDSKNFNLNFLQNNAFFIFISELHSIEIMKICSPSLNAEDYKIMLESKHDFIKVFATKVEFNKFINIEGISILTIPTIIYNYIYYNFDEIFNIFTKDFSLNFNNDYIERYSNLIDNDFYLEQLRLNVSIYNIDKNIMKFLNIVLVKDSFSFNPYSHNEAVMLATLEAIETGILTKDIINNEDYNVDYKELFYSRDIAYEKYHEKRLSKLINDILEIEKEEDFNMKDLFYDIASELSASFIPHYRLPEERINSILKFFNKSVSELYSKDRLDPEHNSFSKLRKKYN